MRERATRAQSLAILPLFLSPVFVMLMRSEGPAIRRVWAAWRSTIEDLVLVLAVGILVAAVAFGVSAWRRERRNHA